ncbi:MAG: hypothetical protein PHO08_07160 [Methylococcales bacterium]|nr:hypothetical protein [Methylococcales bacterium]MDD5631827.1 hypothetical protein [Methylococcales bacterium]
MQVTNLQIKRIIFFLSFSAGLVLSAIKMVHAEPSNSKSTLDPNITTSLTKFGMTMLIGSADQIAKNGKSAVSASNATALGKDLTNLTNQYREKVRSATYVSSLVKSNGELIIDATQALATASGIGAAPAAAIATVARYGNSKFADSIAQEGKDRAVGLLGAGLKTMAQKDKDQFDTLLKNNKYEEAADFFDQKTGSLSKLEQQFGDNEQDAKYTVRPYIYANLQKTSSAALIAAGEAKQGIENVEIQLGNFIKISKKFEKSVTGKIGELKEKSDKLQADIDNVSNDLDSLKNDQSVTAYQVGLVQDMLFDQQPPKIKLAMLDADAKPGLSVQQRTELKAYFEVEIKKQEIMTTANEVVSVVSDVNTIMTHLGIKDQRVSDAVRYGSAAVNALGQAFTGNYFGAIATVSGLFGPTQEDSAQRQFQAVFSQLREIQKSLDQIIDLQKETLTKIEALSKQLADVEKRIQERFDNIDFELKTISSASRYLIWKDYDSCRDVWWHSDYTEKDHQVYDFNESTLQFRSIKGVLKLLNDQYGNVFPCAKKLRNLYTTFRDNSKFENPLQIEFARQNIEENPNEKERTYGQSDLETFQNKVYKPSEQLIEACWVDRQQRKPGWGHFAGSVMMLSMPSATSKELLDRVHKLDALSSSDKLHACSDQSLLGLRAKKLLCVNRSYFDPSKHNTDVNEQIANNKAKNYMQVAIVRDQINDLVNFSSFVANAADFAPGGADNQKPYTLEELAEKSNFSYGKEILEGTLMMLDVAIAQQTMIYGDLTAYFVFEQLWDTQNKRFKKPETPTQQLAWKLLENENNPWLGRNAMMLILESTMKVCQREKCDAADIQYQTVIENFYPTTQDEGKPEQLKSLTEKDRQAGKDWLLTMFDITSEALFEEVETQNGKPIPRRVVMKLDGLELQLPELSDWKARRLSYPPALLERIHERELLAQRWADYAVFDTKSNQSYSEYFINVLAEGKI